jgi:transcriptional activator SPT7
MFFFCSGNFADAIGDDFLGLRELGIADELGMTSLTIPRRLLRGKKDRAAAAAKAAEPALPYPLPPPFIPLTSDKVEDQIGLLRPYYESRFAALAPSYPPQPLLEAAPMEGIIKLELPDATQRTHGLEPQPSEAISAGNGISEPPDPLALIVLTLPDDQPQLIHTKMGPLGQINKVSAATTQSKKKATQATTKPALVAPPMSASHSMVNSSHGENAVGLNGNELRAGTPMSIDSPSTPSKKKGVVNFSTPGGRKKGPGDSGSPNPGHHMGVISAFV